ncbi:MAG TPA: DUF2147 domain-containing protein [Rhodobacteraceae bacterium]|nr:DUF2147 domain-containing protein [Paracoccaceae bacterium]
MKRLGLLLAMIFGLAAPAFADPVEGIWKTKPGDDGNYGYIKISTCGANICGVIYKAFNASGKEIDSDNIGKKMIWGMAPQGGGYYSGGKIWAPDRDKTYKSKMQLSGNSLEVSGCVLGGVICRGQTWSRVK